MRLPIAVDTLQVRQDFRLEQLQLKNPRRQSQFQQNADPFLFPLRKVAHELRISVFAFPAQVGFDFKNGPPKKGVNSSSDFRNLPFEIYLRSFRTKTICEKAMKMRSHLLMAWTIEKLRNYFLEIFGIDQLSGRLWLPLSIRASGSLS